ncbi:hypothetical protein OJAV_G00011170 [Oryzias javanicus]|uniref:Ig-like domain-containing protein n=1 Tax=Oryzias javanicus TaxID=123683 RepID=A0A437DNW8_ORYJA|nr:hypothetical protein OJAV_G00011170 [Oryzias javanicus]
MWAVTEKDAVSVSLGSARQLSATSGAEETNPDVSSQRHSGSSAVDNMKNPGIHSQTWRVEYSSTQICALEGSTVEMSCTYSYPPWIEDKETVVQRIFWFTKLENNKELDLREDPDYADRITYDFSGNNCLLRISGLKLINSAEFRFRFETNQPGGRFTGSPGVTLTVIDLKVQIQTKSWYPKRRYRLEMLCQSRCPLPPHSSYVWYINGRIITDETQQKYSDSLYSDDGVSCAVRGHESLHSPVVCVDGDSCDKVSYSERSICAFRGSSVTISCSFQYQYYGSSGSWISVRGQQTYQDTGNNRFQVQNDRSGSSLTITDLTDGDSDEYRFKPTWWWSKDFPGTTLTVVDLHVEVIRSGLGLVCHSSCFPPGHCSFIWFKNGEKVQGETSSIYREAVSPEDTYSCSYEGQRSPEVYAPKSVSALMNLTEILEGSSVTLTCSSDANPAANYTWFKENQTLLLKDPHLIITSVNRSDSGKYHCVAENKLGKTASEYVFINIEYPPENSSVFMNSSAEILEDSSLKPAAAARITFTVLLFAFLPTFLWIRKFWRVSEQQEERPANRTQVNMSPDINGPSAEAAEQLELHHSSIHFSENQEDCLNSSTE